MTPVLMEKLVLVLTSVVRLAFTIKVVMIATNITASPSAVANPMNAYGLIGSDL